MVSGQDLERYLHDHIPLSRAMGATVRSVSVEGVTLEAPLAPNLNHRGTVFGGSASSLAILSAWALVHSRLRAEGLDSRLVIQRNTMAYERPMDGSFTATSALARPEAWPAFLRTLRRMGRARVAVVSMLRCDGQATGRFEGDFVALEAAGHPVSGD
ncbi:MAG TPA: YiiD C-terminal domain-containing protein [Holophagaceae bacterium]